VQTAAPKRAGCWGPRLPLRTTSSVPASKWWLPAGASESAAGPCSGFNDQCPPGSGLSPTATPLLATWTQAGEDASSVRTAHWQSVVVGLARVVWQVGLHRRQPPPRAAAATQYQLSLCEQRRRVQGRHCARKRSGEGYRPVSRHKLQAGSMFLLRVRQRQLPLEVSTHATEWSPLRCVSASAIS